MGERLRVLVACEESQEVCKAFRALGHESYSCDILPTRGGHPEWHFAEDIMNFRRSKSFDIMIAFVPCDHLAVSGAKWFEEKRNDGRQYSAIRFFLDVWSFQIPKIVIENPIGIMSGKRKYLKEHFQDLYEGAKVLPKPQIIQPWQFGHGETKATCLWLKGLPKLQPTNIVEGREAMVHKMAPGPTRARDRARTYPGIAAAMAEQWGGASHSGERVR